MRGGEFGLYRGIARKMKRRFNPREWPFSERHMSCVINDFRSACQRQAWFSGSKLNRHTTGPSTQGSQTHRVKGAIEEEKIRHDGPILMDLTVLDECACSRRISSGRT